MNRNEVVEYLKSKGYNFVLHQIGQHGTGKGFTITVPYTPEPADFAARLYGHILEDNNDHSLHRAVLRTAIFETAKKFGVNVKERFPGNSEVDYETTIAGEEDQEDRAKIDNFVQALKVSFELRYRSPAIKNLVAGLEQAVAEAVSAIPFN